MPALGVKVAAAAGTALVLLVPAFNSLNQVTVQDVDPPFTLEDPPPNLPPPEEGDDVEVEVPPQDGPTPTGPDCPPPVAEERWSYRWDFPQQPQGDSERFVVSSASGGLVSAANLSNFVGRLVITLSDPEGSSRVLYEFDSADSEGDSGQRVGNGFLGKREIAGAAPGEWTARVEIGTTVNGLFSTPATGHVDFQIHEGFPCGGIGRA